jgi:hypothetical protein
VALTDVSQVETVFFKDNRNAEANSEKSDPMFQKRFGPVVILLAKVIGGQLLAGAAKAAIDVAKAKLEPEGSMFKDFDQVG